MITAESIEAPPPIHFQSTLSALGTAPTTARFLMNANWKPDTPATAPPLRWVHLVVAVPGPFDRWLAVSRGEAAVHLAVSGW
jgi:hypothetical protein